MTVKLRSIATIIMVLTVGGCGGLWGDDQFTRYSQRIDMITPDGGNAKEVNAATHMYHPWPPGIYDRQIVVDSSRLQRALDRYRKSQRPNDTLPEITDSTQPEGTGLSPPPEPIAPRPPANPAPGTAYSNGQ